MVLLCASLAAVSIPAIVSAQIEPQYSPNSRFQIPFSADPAEMRRIGAVELRLHVSTDGGATWTVADALPPGSARFTFQAPGNGAYLFAVQTIDQAGGGHPGPRPQPSLMVVVDNAEPTFDLNVTPAGPGQLEVAWQAEDDNLDLSSLRIEHLDALSGAWQPLTVSPSAVGSARFANLSTDEVMVRGSISDLAGNTVTSSATGSAPSQQEAQSHQRSVDFRDPVADAQSTLRRAPNVTSTATGGAMLPMILPSLSSAPAPTRIAATNQPASVPQQLLPTQPQALGAPVQPGIDNQALYSPPLPATDIRRVNSRTFRIGYEVSDVGPSGVGSVELYITEDAGARWFHYGSDPDRQSPFEVVVPRDGRYGFTIRVRNGLGVVGDPPQPGEPAEIAIVVDETPPTARLMPLSQTAVDGNYQVRISWFIQDERLADRPVALYQSASTDGPWESITGWIENQGRYLWTVNALAPRKIYVKLQARDAAGNTTEAITNQPIMIDTSRPTARILDVDPVGGSR